MREEMAKEYLCYGDHRKQHSEGAPSRSGVVGVWMRVKNNCIAHSVEHRDAWNNYRLNRNLHFVQQRNRMGRAWVDGIVKDVCVWKAVTARGALDMQYEGATAAHCPGSTADSVAENRCFMSGRERTANCELRPMRTEPKAEITNTFLQCVPTRSSDIPYRTPPDNGTTFDCKAARKESKKKSPGKRKPRGMTLNCDPGLGLGSR